MAQYTVLSDKNVQTILMRYGIQKISSYKVLIGGSENTNYVVNANDKRFVLTICEQKSVQEAQKLALLLNHLDCNNFNTSKLVKTVEGALTVTFNNKPVLLKKFIEGTIIQDFPEHLLIHLGKELAKLHQIKAPDFIANKVAFGLEHFDEVQVYAPESSFYKWLVANRKYIEKYMHSKLPKSLIHSDIFYNNIIVTSDLKTGTIMDFEEACYYYRVFDIGMMIVGTCCENKIIDLQKAVSLLKGYQKENQLLDIEKKSLKAFTVYAATATAFWRHQNFNYINVIPEKKGHYLAMKKLADAIVNIPDDDFLQSIGL